MSLVISGKVISGHGGEGATKNLPIQLPLYPETIRKALHERIHPGTIHFGTINVQLSRRLSIPDETCELDTGEELIKWSDRWVPERFRFKKCTLKVQSHEHRAWIYRPSATPHRFRTDMLEIITEFIPDLRKDDDVDVMLD